MATIQIKRRTSSGTGPLTGSTGSVKAGEPLVDFNGGKLYIAKANKTASTSNQLTTSDYLTIPGEGAVNSQIDSKISAQGFGTASKKNVGTSSGQIPVLNGDGKLADSVIPRIAMTNTFVVASESAMLGLSSAQEGDVAIRTDLNKSFILKTSGYNVKANWQELLTPTDKVQSVNGKTGAVNISLSELGGVSTGAFNSHTGNTSTHLSSKDREKLDGLLQTIIWADEGASYTNVKDDFQSQVIPYGLVLCHEPDPTYSMPKQNYYLGIDKKKVLTPSSTIDGGTY